MTTWDNHNRVDWLPVSTQREIAVELAVADREREAKGMTARRLTALEKRTCALEHNTVSKAMLNKRTDTIFETVGRAVGQLVREDLAELEARVMGEANVKDRGVWKSSQVYTPGELVSDGGSAWLCKSTTMDRPGTSDAYRLVAKRGRDRRVKA